MIPTQIGKLHILFGVNDGWSPLSYRDNLLNTVQDKEEVGVGGPGGGVTKVMSSKVLSGEKM